MKYEVWYAVDGGMHVMCIVYGEERARQVFENYRARWAIYKRGEFRGGLRLLTTDESMEFEHNWKKEGF